MQTRKLGPFEVSAIGLGCMSLSHGYGPPAPREQAERVLKGALDAGYTFLDTAAVYGVGHNETLIGEVLGDRRQDYVLASKCGLTNGDKRELNGHPDVLKATCEGSLKRLKTDVIDLYYLHRWDKRVPIEDSVGALAELVAEGKIKAIGLSEVSADTLRRAHAVHPIAALQTEYSPWTRNPEIAVLQACKELGVTFVAFSPVGRGFLAGGASDPAAFQDGDMRLGMPRFQGEAFAANLKLFEAFAALAREAGCTPAQLCLAWLLTKDETIVPIPGTTNPDHMLENAAAAAVTLSPETMARVEALVNPQTVTGPRYSPAMQASIDTEG
ncbi:MAG: aldo/keto reductase [Phenylobacterium sp.]|jgi:aryl-alcohol dehydrogenase-like predicted oxidoreductase|uniref:aldo/keto reductase n=1 Tax=Phenylobacterium sp. TaxID=1871053 RepID=UPI001B5E4033|nr:aldo/keto reductase [Phenylobacterium sp.]MBP7649322.1 aldo/keto reductase [Phenylobacterium sp.]MBP7817514.1 aldo/keto reductase [Phenylobacterium sp.]MBP9230250.1 aldo/keto reductase [Phenylobacterium sp.]MBP9753855.1 aldo/keto reductase [Phenylobacterium sp.]